MKTEALLSGFNISCRCHVAAAAAGIAPDTVRLWRSRYGLVKGGVAYRVSEVNPTTARTWVRSQKLQIGTKRAGGHSGYDLIDIVCLALMKSLMREWGVEGKISAHIVNSVREFLPSIIDCVSMISTDTLANTDIAFPLLVISSNAKADTFDDLGISVKPAQTAEELIAALAQPWAGDAPIVFRIASQIRGLAHRLSAHNSGGTK